MAGQFASETIETLYELLDDAIRLDLADKGNIQLYCKEQKVLQIVAQRGFKSDFLEMFREVRAFDPSACGRALGVKSMIIIDDVLRDMACKHFILMVQTEDFRSVKSIPLVNDAGEIVGVLSTHFRLPQFLLREKGEVPKNLLQKISGVLENMSAGFPAAQYK